jgi:hypothetical protein
MTGLAEELMIGVVHPSPEHSAVSPLSIHTQ